MKNIIVILALCLFGTQAKALQFYESFSYPPASALGGQGGWVLSSGNSPVIQAGTLSTPGLAPAGEGNSVAFAGGAMEVRHAMRNTLGGEQPGTYFYSLTFTVTNLAAVDGGFIAAFSRSIQPSDYGGLLYLRDCTFCPAGSFAYNIGVAKTSGVGAEVVWDPTEYHLGQTNFVVCKYSTSEQGDTSTLLWINPDPSTYGVADGNRPAPTLVATTGADLLGGVGQMVLHQTSATASPGIVLDQIRVEGAWPHVTPVPLTIDVSTINDGNDLFLSWGGNQNIFLQQASSLTPPVTWANVTSDSSAHNYTVPNYKSASSPRFYRIHAWYVE